MDIVKLQKTQRHKLKKLIDKGKLSKLQRYINKQEIDVKRARMKHGDSLLHCACRNIGKNSCDIVKYLLDRGLRTDIFNNQHETPLHMACSAASKDSLTDVILMLIQAQPSVLDQKDSNGRTPRNMMNAFKKQLRQEHEHASKSSKNVPAHTHKNSDRRKYRSSVEKNNESKASMQPDGDSDISSNSSDDELSDSEADCTSTGRLGTNGKACYFNDSETNGISDASDSEAMHDSWNNRLAAEIGFEMGDNDTETLWSSYNDSEANSYAEWADDIAAEHRRSQQNNYHQYRQQKKANSTGSKSSTAGYSKPIPQVSEEKKKEFKRKMAAAQKEHLAALEAKKVNKLTELKEVYETECERILRRHSEDDAHSTIAYDDVPWPHKKGGGVEDVGAFLFADLKKESAEYVNYLRKQRVRWHPDRFLQRCGQHLKKADYDRVLCKVTEISKLLNNLYRESAK